MKIYKMGKNKGLNIDSMEDFSKLILEHYLGTVHIEVIESTKGDPNSEKIINITEVDIFDEN